jgi:hypothetical protein
MAYAGDLKSPDAHASCGFDPHPGYSSLPLKMHQLTRPAFPYTSGVLFVRKEQEDLASMRFLDRPRVAPGVTAPMASNVTP